MNQRAFITDDGRSVLLPPGHAARIGAGGQGQVFRSQLGGNAMAVKLTRQLEEPRLIALQRLEGKCGTIATLPRHRLYHCRDGQRGSLAGYAMRYVDSKRSVSAARLFNFEEIAGLQRFSWRDAVLAALRLAESVAQLHRHGVVIGDLNPENVLFEQQGDGRGPSTWRAVLLDSDSFQIADRDGRFHCPVSRPPYTAPELIGADFSTTWRQPSSDAFALAVIVYQLLLHDHPYDNALLVAEPELEVTARIRRTLYPHAAAPAAGLLPGPYRPAPGQISGAIDAAFRRSFCSLAALRPTAAEWVLLLRHLHSQVVPCQRNPRHQHPREQECLWCAVEQRIGQPICRYSPAAAQAQPKPEAKRPDPELEPLVEQLELARDLVERRAMLVEQLLQLQPVLVEMQDRCSSPEHLVDGPAVLQRLEGLRHRFSRWLGHQQKVNAREQHAALLIELAAETVAYTQQQGQRLEQERQSLMNRLARCGAAELADHLPLHDPQRSAELLWRQAAERRQQQWLQQQLAKQPLRSWRVEGFGEGRMTLLERHGLERGDQLLERIEQLTALPGIGQGLQQRLHQHLQAEINQLLTRPADSPLLGDDDNAVALVLGAATLERIQHHQQAVDDLQREAAAVAIGALELNQDITRRLEQRDVLLADYNRMF
jgi:DNA-binding helix-hairpin-helix protein with protein kinase domain